MKFDMCFKNIKIMQFNDQILKIYSHVNLFRKICSLKLQLSLQLNFVLKTLIPYDILGPYKQKEKHMKFLLYQNLERYVACNIDNVTIMQ